MKVVVFSLECTYSYRSWNFCMKIVSFVKRVEGNDLSLGMRVGISNGVRSRNINKVIFRGRREGISINNFV